MGKIEEYLKLKNEEGKEFFDGDEKIAKELQKKGKALLDSFTKEELISLKNQTPNIYGRMLLQNKIDAIK